MFCLLHCLSWLIIIVQGSFSRIVFVAICATSVCIAYTLCKRIWKIVDAWRKMISNQIRKTNNKCHFIYMKKTICFIIVSVVPRKPVPYYSLINIMSGNAMATVSNRVCRVLLRITIRAFKQFRFTTNFTAVMSSRDSSLLPKVQLIIHKIKPFLFTFYRTRILLKKIKRFVLLKKKFFFSKIETYFCTFL